MMIHDVYVISFKYLYTVGRLKPHILVGSDTCRILLLSCSLLGRQSSRRPEDQIYSFLGFTRGADNEAFVIPQHLQPVLDVGYG